MLKFKKGAFAAEKMIKPILMVWNLDGTFYPAYDIMELLPLAIMMWSSFCMQVTILDLPEFAPNDYLFSTHSDKGTERWEIYAWAARDFMAKAGNLKTYDM